MAASITSRRIWKTDADGKWNIFSYGQKKEVNEVEAGSGEGGGDEVQIEVFNLATRTKVQVVLKKNDKVALLRNSLSITQGHFMLALHFNLS